jgi:hypothetical protein
MLDQYKPHEMPFDLESLLHHHVDLSELEAPFLSQ